MHDQSRPWRQSVAPITFHSVAQITAADCVDFNSAMTESSPASRPLTAERRPRCSDASRWVDFASDLVSSCTESVSASNRLPTDTDYTYHDAFPAFRHQIATLKSALLSTIAQLIQVVEHNNEFDHVLNDRERVQCLTEATDMALERVDTVIDRRWKSSSIANRSIVDYQAAKDSHRSLQDRPQARFRDSVDNSCEAWRPILRQRLPNHHTSGEQIAASPALAPGMARHIQSLGVDTSALQHPYKSELHALAVPDHRLRPRAETLYKSLQDTEYAWVDTEYALRQLANALCEEREFAVDLEHHNFRSYLGFTCLMQISTRTRDYVVDTISLRHCMHVLLDAFTNPAIVKVFHGADFDICWLQKDFSLFVVNMFDTGQAARVLQLPSFSLKYLLDHYCDVQTSKSFQRADWRVRPIPAPMIAYARSDTHYLLFIYDRMSNQLVHQSVDALLSVHDRSRLLCLKLFEKPVCHATSYRRLIQQFQLSLDARQEAVLRDLYMWRDRVSRQVDESCGYVLPNAVLINICRAIPMDEVALLKFVPNLSNPFRFRISDVLHCIRNALLDVTDAGQHQEQLGADANPPILSSPPAILSSPPAMVQLQPVLVPLCLASSQVVVESTQQCSTRMFHSDSDSDSDVEDAGAVAAQAVRMRLLQSLELNKAQ